MMAEGYIVTEEERLRYQLRAQEKAEHDRVSELGYAIEKGKAEGIEEGIELGIEKGKLEDAQNMILMGFDNDTIMKITHLSLADLQALRQQVGVK